MTTQTPALDITQLRKTARQHIEEGAVTAGYSADRQGVIDMLNEALATELVDEAEVEHDSTRVLIRQLQRMQPGDDKYAATFHVLAEYVRHHVKEEESRLFRKLTRSTMDWPQLLEDMLVRREQLMDELGPGGEALNDVRVPRAHLANGTRQ